MSATELKSRRGSVTAPLSGAAAREALRHDDDGLPQIYEAEPGTDFFEWHSSRREQIEARLRSAGAVLFRGFQLADRAAFGKLLECFCRKVIAGYGDLPPEHGTDRIYGSTPYRADRPILFHNESSHMASWPTLQFFACVAASPIGGATPLADCRRIYRRLPPEVLAPFAHKGLLYVRNFIKGLDVSWQDFFKVTRQSEVEQLCKERGWKCEWKRGGTLKVMQPAQAVARNAVTGEWAFFNQIMLHHSYFLPAEDRKGLEIVFGAGGLPRGVTYGDGTAIPQHVLALIFELYESESVSFQWQPGDALMLDNMSVAHGRATFSGPRKIIVGMGDPIELYRSP